MRMNAARTKSSLPCLVASLALMTMSVSAQTSFRFQNGVDTGHGAYLGTHDTYIYSTTPTVNHGETGFLWTDASPPVGQILIRFDDIIGLDPGQIDPDSYLAYATFGFRTWVDPGGSPGNHTVWWMDQPWDDQTITYGNSFGGNGIQNAETAGQTKTIGPTNHDQAYTIGFRTTVKAWVDGQPNEGLLIKTTSSNGLGIHSSEAPNAADRPALSVWTLPDGLLSFADVVVSYSQGGGTNTNNTPSHALGDDPNTSLSLGWGGTVVLQFTDNLLSGSGDAAPDLWIYEDGPSVEGCSVSVSDDGIQWSSVGVTQGGTEFIDIDAFGFDQDDTFRFLRLVDDNLNNSGAPTGADITRVAAINSHTWTDLGGGTEGIQGFPTIAGSGSLVGGAPASVSLTNAPSNALTVAWISFAPTPFAALGGTVHAFPFASQLLLFANAAGEFSASTTWPVGIPSDTCVWFQFLVEDVSTVHGITLSNGLKATTP